MSLAERLRGREPLRFLFVKMPAPADVELAGAAGFDAVILDTEHGPASGPELEHHLRAAAAAGIAALVRVPGAQAAPILAALDAGATGIVVPHVTDAATARRIVGAAHYPPRGHRGLALTTRAGRYGTVELAEHLDRAARETLVVAQIEDAEAVDRAPEIAAVDGVDAVLIGTADLSISMGHPGAPDDPDVRAAVGRILDAGRRAGVAVAAVVARPAEAEAWRQRGASVAVFVSTLLARDALRSAITGSAVAGPVAGDGGGSRDPLVLVPGMLGTEELWDDVAPALSELVPLRFARIDLDDAVEEMAASVLAAAPDRFALAGHSLGAIVALAVVRRAPGRVTRLALLGASARPASEEQLATWAAMEAQVQAGEFDSLAAGFARGNLPEARREERQLVARIEAMAARVGPRGLLRQLSAQGSRPDHRPLLARITCPTVVVSGELDGVCPGPLQEELATAIRHASLERLAGCGHMAPLEAPVAVAAILRDLVG